MAVHSPRHQFPIEKQEILTAAPSVVAGNVGNKQIKAYFTAVIIVTALNMLPQDRLHYSLSTQVLVNEALKIWVRLLAVYSARKTQLIVYRQDSFGLENLYILFKYMYIEASFLFLISQESKH